MPSVNRRENDVAFDEYTDFEMTELSKTFNQYRKQVEQLAYCDPVFSVGNRPKYFRDAQMLISYDKRRRFDLFCIDICSFSQYNELFSADIGDAILRGNRPLIAPVRNLFIPDQRRRFS